MTAGEKLARRTTRDQGLPVKIEDPRTVALVAEMFGPLKRSKARRKAAAS